MSSRPEHFYFVGICGTAMGSVAAALKDRGYRVTGSDAKVYPPMSTFLEGKGIQIIDGFRESNIPEDADHIVIGNAMSRGNPEVEAILNRKLRYYSLPEVLRNFFLLGKRNFIVTGTHGKTTTTSLLAWLLEHGGKDPSFMIGGLPANFGQGCRLEYNSEFFVLEGDEYDTAFFDKRSKFIHYLPELAIVNNIEFDHADIFDDLKAVKKAFSHMVRLVPANGLLCVNGDDENVQAVVAEEAHAPVKKIGFGESCDAEITEVDYLPEGTSFTLEGERYQTPLLGEFNVRNAAMAVTAARFAGLDPDTIRAGLLAFKGIARRQEIRGETTSGIKVVDDFGHHPTAIREALTGMRRRFNGARLWAVFEPRSATTRRNVFQKTLPEALGLADGICISEIEDSSKVPADQRLNPEKVMADLRAMGKPAYYERDADAIVARLKDEAKPGDVIIVFSNGGFGGIHGKLLSTL